MFVHKITTVKSKCSIFAYVFQNVAAKVNPRTHTQICKLSLHKTSAYVHV